jgi:hypothetical protein
MTKRIAVVTGSMGGLGAATPADPSSGSTEDAVMRRTYWQARIEFEVKPLRIKETLMLSPHEFSTLLLVKEAPDQIELDRDELHALLEHQLVTVDLLASGHRRPRITPYGHAILQAVLHIH